MGDVPAPVLNRERAPMVNLAGVQQGLGRLAAAGQSDMIPLAPFTAPGQGLQAVGEGMQSLSGVFAKLAEVKAEAKNDLDAATAVNALDMAYAEHEKRRQTLPADQWEDDWAKRSTVALAGVMANDKLAPVTRRRLELYGQKWSGQTAVRVARDATQTIGQRAENELFSSLERDMANENFDAVDAKIAEVEGAIKNGRMAYIDPGRLGHARIVNQKAREAAKKQAEVAVMKAHEGNIINMAKSGNLDLALKQLDAPGFMGGKADPADIEVLRNKAQAAWRDRSAAELDGLANDIASGKISSAKEIEAVDSPFITPALKKEAVRMLVHQSQTEMARDREENGVANAVKYRRAVKDYDPKSDPDRVKYFTLMHEISGRVEQSSAGEITGDLYRKYGATPPKLAMRPEIQQNISKSLDVTFDPETGAFPWRVKTKDALGRETTKEDIAQRQRALDAQTAVEIKINDWFREHPEDAQNLNKAKAKMAELLPEATREATVQSLMRLMAPKTAAVKASAPVDAETFKSRLPAGLKDHAQDFIDAGAETGLDPYFLAGIAMFETGDGTSPAFRNKNNAMGISNSKGPVALPSVRDSILRQARTLARPTGPYAGKETIDEIGAVYAPPGAGNDPNGTNDEWPAGVKSKIKTLLGQ